MDMSFSAFGRLCNSVGKYPNPDPGYIPSMEEIGLLVSLTQRIRPAFTTQSEREEREHSDSSYHIGRPYVIEKGLSFITRGKENEPLISESSLYAFLVFISETAQPDSADADAAFRLSELNRFLRENLIIT